MAEIFRRYGDAYRQANGGRSSAQRRVMTAIETCRTAALGGHVEPCNACGHERIAYHACANRHCPTCQSLARAAWLERRTAELLDTEYFPGVFTVPALIAARALRTKRVVSRLLVRATADPVRTMAADPDHLGAAIGVFAVLHTWGQTLTHPPPLHGVIPGGGLSLDGTRWVACRPGFFLPVRVLSRFFRRRVLDALQAASDAGTVRLEGAVEALRAPHAWTAALADLRQTAWVVYAKRPFAGPAQVLDDVGRYTHRVALSNHRLVDMDHGNGRFTYKDYRAPSPQTPTIMTLAARAFIRRFLRHVLPTGLHRIRSYGVLGARHRRETLARCRGLLGTSPSASPPPTTALDDRDRVEALTGHSLRVCPVGHRGERIRVAPLTPTPRGGHVIPDTS